MSTTFTGMGTVVPAIFALYWRGDFCWYKSNSFKSRVSKTFGFVPLTARATTRITIGNIS
jgi:hypothetical protein